MKKQILTLAIFLITTSSIFSQMTKKTLVEASILFCKCLTEKGEKVDNKTYKKNFGECFQNTDIQSKLLQLSNEDGFKEWNEEAGMKVGKALGNELLSQGCLSNNLGIKEAQIASIVASSKNTQRTMFVEGKFEGIEGDDLVTIVLKGEFGQTYKVTILEPFVDYEKYIGENLMKLKGKVLKISFSTATIFRKKDNDIMIIKEVRGIQTL